MNLQVHPQIPSPKPPTALNPQNPETPTRIGTPPDSPKPGLNPEPHIPTRRFMGFSCLRGKLAACPGGNCPSPREGPRSRRHRPSGGPGCKLRCLASPHRSRSKSLAWPPRGAQPVLNVFLFGRPGPRIANFHYYLCFVWGGTKSGFKPL